MNVDGFHGFRFLPPSVRVPPELRPVRGATVTADDGSVSVPGPIAGAVYGAPLIHAADHVFPLGLGQT